MTGFRLRILSKRRFEAAEQLVMVEGDDSVANPARERIISGASADGPEVVGCAGWGPGGLVEAAELKIAHF